jgi:dihydrofolate reductase
MVCSRTLQTVSWNNSTLVRDNAAAEVARLKQQGNGNIFVFGSAHLSKSLMIDGLFDEYRIGIAPVIYGNGRPLFSNGSEPQNLELIESRPLSNGCVILRYRRVG